jgi:isopenicillin-N epimerase
MSAMLITSHPAPVRDAITRHRRGLDTDRARYLEAHNTRLTRSSLAAAGRYLDVEPERVALTDSTTAGIGLVYGGLALRPGQEILTTDQDYFVTHEAVRLACRRTGAVERRVPLFADIRSVSVGELVGRLAQAISPTTRVLGLTWVHSSTGLKLPLAEIGKAVAELNRGRDEASEVLMVVDGVHGFGNQDTGFLELARRPDA